MTLHSPKLETTKAPEPFRAAASETQLDVEPEFGETKLHSPQDHMAAWNPAQEAPKEEPESAPCVETEPDAPEAAEQETVLAEPEQMNFDPTASAGTAALCGRGVQNIHPCRTRRRAVPDR